MTVARGSESSYGTAAFDRRARGVVADTNVSHSIHVYERMTPGKRLAGFTHGRTRGAVMTRLREELGARRIVVEYWTQGADMSDPAHDTAETFGVKTIDRNAG